MNPPKRVRLSRKKGYRKPEGAVVVGRASRWGNPYKVGQAHYLAWDTDGVFTPESAVRCYREMLANSPDFVAEIREKLAGRDLACWCPLDQPCHGDVLLELANLVPS